MLKENSMPMTSSFADKLNNDFNITIDRVSKGVIKICSQAQLITNLDINNRTRRYLWLEDIMERHILALSLLHQLMLEQTDVSQRVIDSDEWIAAIIQNVSRRVLEERLP